MDYSYRNTRQKKRKRRQYRRFLAVIAVVLTAGFCAAGYGLVNLIADMGGEKEGKEAAVSPNVSIEESNETHEETRPVETEKVSESGAADEDKTLAVKTEEKKENEKDEKKRDEDIKNLVTISDADAENYYKNAAFIGDSRTQGLQINAGLKNPDFFAGRGLNVKNALTEKVVPAGGGTMMTVVDALESKGKKYEKIYICFGLNELGWTYPHIFIERYKELIKAVREKQQDAKIVVYSILPVTQKKSKNDKIFNKKNIKKFNKLIKKMAKEIKVTYADLSPSVRNEKGFLPKEVTPDGVHMNREYCKRILAYIVNKKI